MTLSPKPSFKAPLREDVDTGDKERQPQGQDGDELPRPPVDGRQQNSLKADVCFFCPQVLRRLQKSRDCLSERIPLTVSLLLFFFFFFFYRIKLFLLRTLRYFVCKYLLLLDNHLHWSANSTSSLVSQFHIFIGQPIPHLHWSANSTSSLVSQFHIFIGQPIPHLHWSANSTSSLVSQFHIFIGQPIPRFSTNVLDNHLHWSANSTLQHKRVR